MIYDLRSTVKKKLIYSIKFWAFWAQKWGKGGIRGPLTQENWNYVSYDGIEIVFFIEIEYEQLFDEVAAIIDSDVNYNISK